MGVKNCWQGERMEARRGRESDVEGCAASISFAAMQTTPRLIRLIGRGIYCLRGALHGHLRPPAPSFIRPG
jgi:hypothetical protein